MITFQEATTMPANQVSTFVDAVLRRVAIEYAYMLLDGSQPREIADEALCMAATYLNNNATNRELAIIKNLTLSATADLSNERLLITGSADNTAYKHIEAAAFACAPTGRESVQLLIDEITENDDEDLAAWAANEFKTHLANVLNKA